jgi:F-type H+-transporting ATPase subunit alpha
MFKTENDTVATLEKLFEDSQERNLQEIGTVVKVGDGVCQVFGLYNAVFGELIELSGGNRGIILDLDEDIATVILFERFTPVFEQETAFRTHTIYKIPVGQSLLGRVLNAQGAPIDGLGELANTTLMPIEINPPGIVERQPIDESLETGTTVVDTLIPIGKGQRELLIGNRQTGKTTLLIDTILHQKGKNVICIYVAIGQKKSNIARLIEILSTHGSLDYTIIVSADAQEMPLNQFIAPYSGSTIAEFFMKQGKDVLIMYDDLTNHAIAYRELSLLLRRPTGREAYPGDIFYIHSRLLERAGRFNQAYGGGSISAIPVIQTQGDDISAFIPTNLISITDGQIFLDTNLFNNEVRPAVNVGLSVSRVGGSAQTKAIKKVAGSLKLELAQYKELTTFAQFGSELDHTSQRLLDRGKRAIELLKQNRYHTHSFVDQTIFLLLLKENLLDLMPIHQIKDFVTKYADYVNIMHHELYRTIETTKDLNEESIHLIKKIARDFLIIHRNEASTQFMPYAFKSK